MPVEGKFETVHLDIQGPLPITTNGHRFNISAEDALTRFTVVRPLRTQSAKEIARFLYYDYVPFCGPPIRYITDQGANISGDVAHEVAAFFGSHMDRTTPYHPECNGKKERHNQAIAGMLRKLVNDFQNDWDEYLPLVQFAYNATYNPAIGMSPYEAVFGRTAHTPLHATLTPLPRPADLKSDYLRSLVERSEELTKIVINNDIAAKARNKEEYDRRHKEAEIKAGDYVLMKRETGVSNKLADQV